MKERYKGILGGYLYELQIKMLLNGQVLTMVIELLHTLNDKV